MKKYLYLILLFTIFYNVNSQVKYELNCPEWLLLASQKVLYSQVGIQETGNNGGAVVKYLKCVGLKSGNPYCMAGQYYCYWYPLSVKNTNIDYTLIPFSKTGVANYMFNEAAKRGKKVKYNAAIHDFIVWQHGFSYKGHVERIISVENAGWVYTIGFNTSPERTGSQRDGDGVWVKKRNIKYPLSRMQIRGLVGFKTIK